MGYLAIVCCFLNRVNLSVALLKMVNHTYVHEVEREGSNVTSHERDVCFDSDYDTIHEKVNVRCTAKQCRGGL